jgi:hypothetical protein
MHFNHQGIIFWHVKWLNIGLENWGIKNKNLTLDIFSSEPCSWQAYEKKSQH